MALHGHTLLIRLPVQPFLELHPAIIHGLLTIDEHIVQSVALIFQTVIGRHFYLPLLPTLLVLLFLLYSWERSNPVLGRE